MLRASLCFRTPFSVLSASAAVRFAHERQCWKCASALLTTELFFCGSCGVVQAPPPSASFFDIFGLPEKCDLDGEELDRRFKRLQRLLHPDKHATKPSAERERSQASSVLLNQAYQTLMDPLSRAHYILRLHGTSVEESRGTMMGPDHQTFLADMMEKMEAAHDAPRNAPALLRMRDANEAEMLATFQKICETLDRRNYAASVDHVIRLNYLSKLQDVLQDKTSPQ